MPTRHVNLFADCNIISALKLSFILKKTAWYTNWGTSLIFGSGFRYTGLFNDQFFGWKQKAIFLPANSIILFDLQRVPNEKVCFLFSKKILPFWQFFETKHKKTEKLIAFSSYKIYVLFHFFFFLETKRCFSLC